LKYIKNKIRNLYFSTLKGISKSLSFQEPVQDWIQQYVSIVSEKYKFNINPQIFNKNEYENAYLLLQNILLYFFIF
jgi:hypothetical protein